MKPLGTSATFTISLLFSLLSWADVRALPLATKTDILSAYQGSFYVEYSDSTSSTKYAEGRVAYNPENNSVFIDSHVYQLAIAEFKIPETLSTSTNKSDLPKAVNLQPFTTILDKTFTGNPQKLNKLGAMSMINGQLFIQAYVTYDASGQVTDTTAIVDNPNNLSTSDIRGMFKMQGSARTVNYMSPIPNEWQSVLQGTWLAGNGAGMSISSRLSEGPSLFTFNSSDFSGKDFGAIETTKFMEYPPQHALSSSVWQDYSASGYGSWDVYNNSLLNKMWTDESEAWVGFIIPGTRTFAVLGKSGMTNGGGYKITNQSGFLCPGACPYDPKDSHSFYWLYDLNDIIDSLNSYDPLPYEYGAFDDRFIDYSSQGSVGYPSGGSFDAQTGTLVISHKAGTSSHGSGSPIISVYKFGARALNPQPSQPKSLHITPQ